MRFSGMVLSSVSRKLSGYVPDLYEMALTVYSTPSNVKSLSDSALLQPAPARVSSQPRVAGPRSCVLRVADQRSAAPSRGLPDMDAVRV